MKKFIIVFIAAAFLIGCKAKKCANFENAEKDYKLKRDRHGRVKR